MNVCMFIECIARNDENLAVTIGHFIRLCLRDSNGIILSYGL